MSGMVFDIRKYSIHDGPGIRTTVFLKGCPLHCSWCHNPEGQALKAEILYRASRCIQCDTCQAICPEQALRRVDGLSLIDHSGCDLCGQCTDACYAEALQMVGRKMTVEEVLAEVERDVVFYDQSKGGVTFSGGEPLMQFGFLRQLLMASKDRGLHTAVDTTGFATWKVLDSIRELADLFLYDLKLIDSQRHKQHTGVPNEPILQNLQKLARHGNPIIIRIPIIPGINDDLDNLTRSAELAASLPALQWIDLLPYHRIAQAKYVSLGREYPLDEIEPPGNERMEEIADLMAGYGLPVKIGA